MTKIADEYNVSRGTARRALDQLKERGLTKPLQGASPVLQGGVSPAWRRTVETVPNGRISAWAFGW